MTTATRSKDLKIQKTLQKEKQELFKPKIASKSRELTKNRKQKVEVGLLEKGNQYKKNVEKNRKKNEKKIKDTAPFKPTIYSKNNTNYRRHKSEAQDYELPKDSLGDQDDGGELTKYLIEEQEKKLSDQAHSSEPEEQDIPTSDAPPASE